MPLVPRLIFNALLLVTLILFAGGVFSPLMEIEKFWFFSNRYSLASSLQTLLNQREIWMFLVLFVFSIVTPMIKLAVLGVVANSSSGYHERHQRWIGFLETWGKWSMLDVFVVALLMVAVNLGPLAHVTLHYGVYLFAGAVILMQFLSVWLHWVLKRQNQATQLPDVPLLK